MRIVATEDGRSASVYRPGNREPLGTVIWHDETQSYAGPCLDSLTSGERRRVDGLLSGCMREHGLMAEG